MGAFSFQQQINIEDALLSTDGSIFYISQSTLAAAFALIKRKPKYDHYGVNE